jgi:hypothetical protein
MKPTKIVVEGGLQQWSKKLVIVDGPLLLVKLSTLFLMSTNKFVKN